MEFKLDESIQKHYGTFVNGTTFLDANGNRIPLIPYNAPISNGSSNGSGSQGSGDSDSSNNSSSNSSSSSSSSSSSQGQSGSQGGQSSHGDQGDQNYKVKPDPNKIYRDVNSGKSYKWDESKNRFVEMKGK